MAQAPQIGQEVVICDDRYGNHSFGWHITKITPGGRITVENAVKYQYVFGPDGHEYGNKTGWGRSKTIIFDVEGTRAEVDNVRKLREVAVAITKVEGDRRVNHRWEKDGLANEVERLMGELQKIQQMIAEL